MGGGEIGCVLGAIFRYRNLAKDEAQKMYFAFESPRINLPRAKNKLVRENEALTEIADDPPRL